MDKPFSAEQWANMRRTLSLPDDASNKQTTEAVEALTAQAQAKKAGSVATSGIRAAAGLPADAPEQTLGAVLSTAMLCNARRLGMSAAASPKEIRAAIEVEARVLARVRASQQQAAPKPVAVAKPAAAPVAAAPSGRVAAATASDPGGHYATNPAVAREELQAPADVRAAYEVNPEVPTLFASGDVPVFTASGIDPAVLRAVPWYSRHAVAAEADRGKAMAMYEELSGPDGIVAAQDPKYRSHPGNGEYEDRVTRWVMAGMSKVQADREQAAQQAVARRQVEVQAAVGKPEEMTGEQAYEHLFGPINRREAAQAAADDKAEREGRVAGPPRRRR